MSLIRVKDIRKVYRVDKERVVALNRINLEIETGEICCILGTSGSGKSTLLNIMAGLEKPTKGAVFIDGVDMVKLNEKQLALFRQKNIGFIFQSYNLLPTMTAIENVALPLEFKGVPKQKRVKEAKRMLKAVNLEERMLHKPTQMSGGQQQRVGIARAHRQPGFQNHKRSHGDDRRHRPAAQRDTDLSDPRPGHRTVCRPDRPSGGRRYCQ